MIEYIAELSWYIHSGRLNGDLLKKNVLLKMQKKVK